MRIRTDAAAAALLVFAFAGSALAETIGTLPIDYGRIKVEEYEGNDFTLLDKSTNLEWKFLSGDQQFYELLGRLNGAAQGNLAHLAYVGNEPGAPSDHAAWIAPMSADNQPSYHPGRVTSRDATPFDAQALRIEAAADIRGFVLSDGQARVAELRQSDDDSSLRVLKEMLQSNGLNTAWQIPGAYERTITPVGSGGPVVVFLKVDASAQPPVRKAAGTTATIIAPEAKPMSTEPASPESEPQAATGAEAVSCNWWSPRCWSLKAKAEKAKKTREQP